MSNTAIQDIRENLQSISEDIPQYIRTGIPENVQSANVRSLELRNNAAVLSILDLFEDQSANGPVIVGDKNPNEVPPSIYSIGQLYLRQGEAKANKEIYLYTGIDKLGWWRIDNSNAFKIAYGAIADPNIKAPPGAFKIGDYYVETSTADSSGNVLSVWFYTNLHSSAKWISMGGQSSYPEGTLTLLRTGTNLATRVWSASVLSAFIAESLSARTFKLPNPVKLTGDFELEFLAPADVDVVVEYFDSAKNWDITWVEQINSDEFLSKSLKAEFVYAGKSPLSLKCFLQDAPKLDELYLKGNLDGVLDIPANAKFTIW